MKSLSPSVRIRGSGTCPPRRAEEGPSSDHLNKDSSFQISSIDHHTRAKKPHISSISSYQGRRLSVSVARLFLVGGTLALTLVWVLLRAQQSIPAPVTDNNPRPICPNVYNYFQEQDLPKSIEASRIFHTQGGNLKSIQRLLDNNIDATLEKLNVQFVPKDEPQRKTHQVTKYLQDYFEQHHDPRGGYGKQLPGSFDPPNHPLILGNRFIEVADPVNTRERWDASIGPMGPNCSNLLQLGESGQDGTKWYCAPKPQQQSTNVNDNNDCHVISIGGNDHWDFELQVVQKMQGCRTHTFDCTLKNGQSKHKPQRDDIQFYPYCLDSHKHTDQDGRNYLTYADILQMIGLTATTPPRLLKIDVEGFEFDIFSQMIQQQQQKQQGASSLLLPQQIQVELHWNTRMRGLPWMARTRTAAELAIFSSMMFNGGGYMPIYQYWDEHCHSCLEVLFFRTLCL